MELDGESGGFNARVGVKCGRWNPTTEQVKVLTDLFRAGLRTPTTEQIQKISDHLSAFGKVESKNVFYWFQNHKARERHHKKRRRGSSSDDDVDHQFLIPSDICKRDQARFNFKPLTCYRKDEEQVNIWERPKREIETLELFPLKKSYDDAIETTEKMKYSRIELKDMSFFDPPLELRLSFL